jgi:hypothetical protein
MLNLEKSLKDHGFKVFMHTNLDSEQLPLAIEKFKKDYGYNWGNRIIIFFSGHGANLSSSPMGYIVPVDAPRPSKDKIGFLQKSYSLERFKIIAREMQVRHALIALDSCASGSIFHVKGLENELVDVNDEIALPVRTIFTAGRGKENVPEKSIFIPGFIDGLKGDADYTGDGFITGSELIVHIKDYVKARSDDQHPQVGTILKPGEKDSGDFVFRNPIPSAPKPIDIDTGDLLKAKARKKQRERNKRDSWDKWQRKFNENVNKLNELDKEPDIPLEDKISKWKELQTAYRTNNPYSTEDERLRRYIRKKIKDNYFQQVLDANNITKSAKESNEVPSINVINITTYPYYWLGDSLKKINFLKRLNNNVYQTLTKFKTIFQKPSHIHLNIINGNNDENQILSIYNIMSEYKKWPEITYRKLKHQIMVPNNIDIIITIEYNEGASGIYKINPIILTQSNKKDHATFSLVSNHDYLSKEAVVISSKIIIDIQNALHNLINNEYINN